MDDGEDCDLGEHNSNTGECTTTCKLPKCGDGYKQAGEDCDLGEDNSNTGECTTTCKLPKCGDGYKQAGEDCDLGEDNSNTGECTTTCKLPKCGDGYVQDGEACDDKNHVDTDACTNECECAVCGDGIVWAGVEECDDHNTTSNDGCSSTCKKEEVCPPEPPKPKPCKKDPDGDGVCNDGTDKCPGTKLDKMPLNPNHYGNLDADTDFEFGKNTKVMFTMHQTAGCSCTQIVAELGKGNGHLKHGCSKSVMEEWIDYLAAQPLGTGGDEMGDLDTPDSEEPDSEVDLAELDLEQLDVAGDPQMGCNIDDPRGHGPAWAFLGLMFAAVGLRRRF